MKNKSTIYHLCNDPCVSNCIVVGPRGGAFEDVSGSCIVHVNVGGTILL